MAVSTTRQVLRESVADSLGLRATAKVGASPTTTKVNVPQLRNHFLDETPVLEAFGQIQDKASGWRKTDAYDQSTDDYEVETAWDITPEANDILEIYQILTPDEFNAACNEALEDLFFEDRVTVSLVAEQNLYSLSTTATWLQRKGQILRVILRDTIASNKIVELPSSGYELIEQADSLSIYLHNIPPEGVGTVTMVVVAKHTYTALATDAATTTCPLPLLKAEMTYRVLLRVWGKLGSEKAKDMYGAEMAMADRTRARARLDWLPKTDVRDLKPAEPYAGPEFAVDPDAWEW